MTAPTTSNISKDDDLREQIMDIFMAASGMDISPGEYEDQILALIADQQRQLLDHLLKESERMYYPNHVSSDEAIPVQAINDIREGL